MAYDINKQEIAEELLYLNNKYYQEIQKFGIIEDNKINMDVKKLKSLYKKYSKIISKRI